MTIHGTPLHPLVVHAAVVLVPLASLAGLAFAARSGWRWWLRWPMVVVSVAGGASVGAAYLTGRQLLSQRFALAQGSLRHAIDAHRHWAHWLFLITIAYVVVVLLAAWALGGPSPLPSGWGARASARGLARPLLVLLVAGAVAVLVLVVLTGDAGARAVWNP